jgi:anti-anti-sigma factor
LAVRGELDLCTVPELQARLTAAIDNGSIDVVVDISGVDFCDCRGFRALVDATGYAQATGARLTVTNPTRIVRRLFDLLHAEQVLRLDDQI